MVPARFVGRFLERDQQHRLAAPYSLTEKLEGEGRLAGPRRTDHHVGAVGEEASVHHSVELGVSRGDTGFRTGGRWMRCGQCSPPRRAGRTVRARP